MLSIQTEIQTQLFAHQDLGYRDFQAKLLAYMDEKHPEIGNEIEQMKSLSDDLVQRIISAVKEYKSQVVN